MTLKFAVIGLGSMGYGIAQSVLRAGHETYGLDVVPARVNQFIAEGGSDGELKEISGSLDGVMIVVLNAAQTENVLFGTDGIAPLMKKGAVIVSCATVPPSFAIDMEKRCTELGLHYLDAPISGGTAKAAEGRLSIMASGTTGAFKAAKPLLDATAETVFELGDKAGPGSAMKAVNQMLAGSHIATHGRSPDLRHDTGRNPGKISRGHPQMCRNQLDAGKPRAAHHRWRLYSAQFGRHLAKGSRHRARYCQIGKVCRAHNSRRPATVSGRIGLRTWRGGRCGGGQGLCAQRKPEIARSKERLGTCCLDASGTISPDRAILANTLAKAGMRTVQYTGVPTIAAAENVEAGVVALKTRSIDPKEAVKLSLEALTWLKQQGCEQFFFKYCSTFDSTEKGNIGPVADALADALNAHKVIVCPAFPGAGRSIYQGYLFVKDVLLNESGMENHPLTPMKDANLRRLMAGPKQIRCRPDTRRCRIRGRSRHRRAHGRGTQARASACW